MMCALDQKIKPLPTPCISPLSFPRPQILGLTNYSAWPEHNEGRRCVFEDVATREALLGVALQRLVKMKHVGLTERLDESIQSLAATLGAWGVCCWLVHRDTACTERNLIYKAAHAPAPPRPSYQCTAR